MHQSLIQTSAAWQEAKLSGISILTARIVDLIYPRLFQVKQLALRGLFFVASSSISGDLQPASHTHAATSTPSSEAFLEDHSTLEASLRPVASFALAAPQPVGTGRAQIRWSIVPNRRRVRWLSAKKSQ